MIYLWVEPENTRNRDIGVYNEHDGEPDRFLLKKGQPLKQEEFGLPTINFIVSKAYLLKFDCLTTNALVPLVNYKIKMLLESLIQDEVQFFPARCVCTDGELEGYYYLNATHTFVGIDHEKSIYSMISGTDAISGFRYLTYKPGCMGNLHLARDKEYLGNLLVSERIKMAFDNLKITGVRFARSEEYYRPLSELL